jgi:hypothetical protein
VKDAFLWIVKSRIFMSRFLHLLSQTAKGLNYRATDILVWITAAFLRDIDFVTTAGLTHLASRLKQSCEALLQLTPKQREGFFRFASMR